ncbi:hypothetical protein PDESU_00391 [Pontiella desulfatans]|uniref:YubB ferredoxin-like domain-containing protein n=1 Tax=Pontiella desulfatans TaxID=2750659 RepID=A0A6C2TWH0_PONDE|nr:hypothetical protein [Pontiella desulfatans]VGO11844.1 hypothetical protein PDESU_00391 [Pontiella desulfatans]
MPNHCMNQVTLKCRTQETAVRIKDHLAGKESLFDFNALVPEPKELLKSRLKIVSVEELRNQFGHDNWYDWRRANWGTKWNSFQCTLDDSLISNGELVYCFLTAWCPPEGVYEKLLLYIEANNLGVEVSWYINEPTEGVSGFLEDTQ